MRLLAAGLLLAGGVLAGAAVNPVGGQYLAVDFGARCDGATDARIPINAAITAANAGGGGTVLLPRGTCRVDLSQGYVVPKSNVTLAGQGIGVTTVLADDSAGVLSQSTAITNYIPGTGWSSLDRFTLRDMTLKGRADTTHAHGADGVRLGGTNLTIERVESRYSGGFGLAVLYGSDVQIRDNRVFRSYADGIVAWNVSNALITGNSVVQAHDNAISAHSQDGQTSPVRSGIIVSNNIVTESSAISILGAKRARITNNVMSRMLGAGLIFSAGRSGYAQGNTPMFDVVIQGNIIEDVMHNPETPAFNGQQFYMQLDGGPRQAGTSTAPPGEPTPGTGVVASLYGTGHGSNYADPTTSSAVPSPGPYWFVVKDNIMRRTLPSVSAFSDWGYASSAGGVWIAASGDGSGYYNGGVTEADLATPGILVTGPLRHSLIEGNIYDAGGSDCMFFNGAAAGAGFGPHDLDGLTIARNQCRNFTVGGIVFSTAASSPQRVLVTGNTLDGDPYFASGARGAGGTWASSAALPGISAPDLVGLQIEDNRFRDLSVPDAALSSGLHEYRRNVQIGQFASAGYSASNRGLGTWQVPDAIQWDYVVEDSDPTSATYGQVLYTPTWTASSQPLAGTWIAGSFVRQYQSGAASACGMPLLGWRRVTTGSGNTSADWLPIYGRQLAYSTTGFSGSGATITVPFYTAESYIPTVGTLASGTIALPDPSLVPIGCEEVFTVGNLTVTSLAVTSGGAGTVTGAPAAIAPFTPFAFKATSGSAWVRSR